MPPNLFERKALRDSIKACRNCDLGAKCSSPVPFSGPSDPKLVVIGEAPGQQEDAQGAPFIGPSGSLIREWLQESGWNVADEVAFVNVVSCYPNRTPTPKEVDACAGNLRAQLAHLSCERWVVLGGIAVQALVAHQVRIGELRGLHFRPSTVDVSSDTWAVATWHPSAVLRNRQLEFDAHEDVAYFSNLIRKGETVDIRGWRCVKCDTDEDVDYKNDIPYCARHLPK